jgi:hypothetical protein
METSGAIPHRWKLLIRGIGKLKLIENDIVEIFYKI